MNRQHVIGASDVAPILGKSPWRSPVDVYWEKVTGKSTTEQNAAMTAGKVLESAVLDWCQEQLGRPITGRQERVECNEFPVLIATLDGRTEGEAVVEAKTTNILSPWRGSEEWGDEGTDKIPDVYYLQVQAQMLCARLPLAIVPVLIGGVGFRMYKVKAHPKLQDIILEQCKEFWNRVTLRQPPEGVLSLATLKELPREPGKAVDVPDDVVSEYILASADVAQACKRKDLAQQALLLALGDAEIGKLGEVDAVTYRECTRAGYTVAPSTYRKLAVNKNLRTALVHTTGGVE